MKISKLFHWLYAVLMLLPVFAIGVTCAYAIFNKNAYQSYGDSYVEKNITIQTQNDSNTYYLDGQSVTWYLNNNEYTSQSSIYGFSDISLDLNKIFNTNDLIYNGFNFYTSSVIFMYFYDTLGTQHQLNNYKNYFSTFTYTIDLNTYANKPTNTTYGNFVITLLTTAPLSNVFYYSIDKVQQSPLFNWAYDSFLATPITYITGLFGMATDHVAVMFMSYWLAISIIWLVFDMVMYVPLLVHRWIDKGVLE